MTKQTNRNYQYNKFPVIPIRSDKNGFFAGYQAIVKELSEIKQGVLCFEVYPGAHLDILKSEIITKLSPKEMIAIEDYRKSYEEIDALIGSHLFEDRVFGLYSHHKIEDFYDMEKIKQVQSRLSSNGLTVIYGFGASLIPYDHIVMVSLTRWEIQLRYRQGLSNFTADNPDDDILRKYKRGYFIEWRVADRVKDKIYPNLDYVIDLTNDNQPKMIHASNYNEALDVVTKRPFRIVPYFDPGVWGGQWMKEVCDLDKEEENFAWSFDGVPEENSIRFGFGDDFIELPAQDLVQFRPNEFMGKPVYARFGKHFPIRFDFLDTMEGGNLSLQVHPLTEYIQDTFGMTYTQDESYYILDAKDDAVCYVGLKNGVKKADLEKALTEAQNGETPFPDERFINKIPVKKHDHLLLPAGTVHGSGRNTMVLEISSCVYIFTFKLWDWGRLGLDGLPRPVHLDHGFKNIQYDRNTDFVLNECYNQFQQVSESEEITGLHELEFIESRRYSFDKEVVIPTDNVVNVFNLVEGKAIRIESIDNSFTPYIVHYAETFYIPALVKAVRFVALEGHCKVIRAKVRSS